MTAVLCTSRKRSKARLKRTLRGFGKRSKRVIGGSAWESNPASPREQGATDFEDREDHRAPFASVVVQDRRFFTRTCSFRRR
jgi:hypothetical protein